MYEVGTLGKNILILYILDGWRTTILNISRFCFHWKNIMIYFHPYFTIFFFLNKCTWIRWVYFIQPPRHTHNNICIDILTFYRSQTILFSNFDIITFIYFIIIQPWHKSLISNTSYSRVFFFITFFYKYL